MIGATGDWSDTFAAALTLMAVVAGPEVAEGVIRDTFDDACRKADRRARDKHRSDPRFNRLRELLDNDDIPVECVWAELNKPNGRAPQPTVEAQMFGLRHGLEALPTNPDRLRRLSELCEEQLRAVCDRLQDFKPHVAPAWSPEEVRALVDIWSATNVKIIT